MRTDPIESAAPFAKELLMVSNLPTLEVGSKGAGAYTNSIRFPRSEGSAARPSAHQDIATCSLGVRGDESAPG